MKGSRKFVVFLVMVILVLAFSSEAVLGQTKYKMATVTWAGWSPSNVADVKGFWKDEGLDVTLVTFPDPQLVFKSMQKGLVDIGFEMIGSIIGYNQEGSDLVILAESDWSHGGDKIIVKKGASLNSMKGKMLGVYHKSPAVTFFLNKYLSGQGLKMSDFKIIEAEPKPLADHFIQNRIQVIVSFDPEALRAERQGNGMLAATSATYEGCIPEGMYMKEDKYNQINKGDLKKILKGWVRAVKWCQDPANWTEYQQILNQQTFKSDKPYSEKDLREMVQAVKIHDPKALAERNKAGGGLSVYLDELQAFLRSNNDLKRDFSAEKVFRNQHIMEVLQ